MRTHPDTDPFGPRDTPRSQRRTGAAGGLVVALLLLCLAPACATRARYDNVMDVHGLTVRLRSQKAAFGPVVERGFRHPTLISVPRLEHILGALEVDFLNDKKSSIRERKPAIHPALVPQVAKGVAAALKTAGPNQEVVVMALRKQMQKGVFHRKYLTSFIAYVKEDRLYLLLSRVEWKVDDKSARKQLPNPIRGEEVMQFRTVTNENYRYAGRQGVEVEWQSEVFARTLVEPGSIRGKARRKEILAAEPVPLDERSERATREQIMNLSAEELRQLADLEDDRKRGTITEAEYLRARDQLLGNTR